MKNISLKSIVLLLIIGLNWFGLSAIGTTFAYFNDIEKSENTSFEMGILGFSSNSISDFSPNLEPSELTSTRTVDLTNDGTLGFKYKVKVEGVTGGLCSNLRLKDNVSGSFQPLSSFISDTTTFSATSSLIFTADSSSYDESLQGEICNFNLVFEAWQENLGDNTQGFTDREVINSTVKMDYWDSPIVLNEFLPNVNNYPEFIEFYNKGASTIDMDGYYVMADINRIDVNPTNTSAYSNGSTTIDSNDWLVITTGGDKLNNSSGTLTLYNSNGVEMDSYTYDGADHNINNNPGLTNNLVVYLPFDGDLEDKSGNSNDGTNHGTVFSSGKINQAINLDGIDDYIEVADSSSLDITDAITLEAWVYAESWDNDPWSNLDKNAENNILTKGGESSGLGVWSLHHKTTSKGFRFELVDDETPYPLFENTPSIALNQWYHIASTYDGSEMKLYINGALSNFTNEYTGLIKTNDESLIIGKKLWWKDIYSCWDGMIDEVKIYNRALDADEILEHYNDIGPSNTVPVDKSYARIPDGIGDWVDPIPTPGGVNILESDINVNNISLNSDIPVEIVEQEETTEGITPNTELEIVEEFFEEIVEETTEGIGETVKELFGESIDEEIIEEEIDEPVEEIIEEEAIDEEVIEDEEIINEELDKPVEEVIEEEVIEEEVIEEEVIEEEVIDEEIIEEEVIEEEVIDEEIIEEEVIEEEVIEEEAVEEEINNETNEDE